MTASRARLGPGRWHLQHGPIDLLIEAEGPTPVVAAACDRAWSRFTTILDELVGELPSLKRPVVERCPVDGVVARRMWRACHRHRAGFITPMAAVAGAVADELIPFFRIAGVRRAWINNGGDIALHLADGEAASVGLFADLSRFRLDEWRGDVAVDGRFDVTSDMPVRGIATSGWRGRSFSLGIADSVTVLAATAADADAAATMIANAVDVDDPRIVRRSASSLVDDGDLGDRLVTTDVPPLGVDSVHRALSSGLAAADALRANGAIAASALVLQGVCITTAFPRLVENASRHRSAADARWHGTRLNPSPMEVTA